MITHIAELAGLFLLLSATATLAADTENGRKLYFSVGCYACHGGVGQGSISTGPRLAPTPAALPDFLAALRTPRNIMPPYAAKVLPDEAVADIRAFLDSLPPPAPTGL